MAYTVRVTVNVEIENMSSASGLGREARRTHGGVTQTVARSTGGTERYCYVEVEDAADEAVEKVLKMIESTYGRTERQT